MAHTLDELTKLYTSVFYLEDTSVIPLVTAVVLANRLPGDPIWLMIIGGSSSGKSEIINTVMDLEIGGKKKVWQVSNLTENTFLSGAVNKKMETSLLHKIGSTGVIVMKDFTSMISNQQDRAQMVFAQMREIYDGYLTKETGTGVSLEWRGKLNFIGGVTDKIFTVDKKYGGMGTRAVNFIMPLQNRIETTRRALRNNNKIEALRGEVKVGFHQYINSMIQKSPGWQAKPLSEEMEENILKLSDFAALSRSPTERDYKGTLDLIQSLEMPMRMAKQLYSVANTFMFMCDNEMLPEYENIIYKIALDSIPKQRRMAIQELSRYDKATTAGIATKLRYPTETVREWLEDLNVFGICDRIKGGPVSADCWTIKEEYRLIMEKFDGIKKESGTLKADDDLGSLSGEEIDPGYMKEVSMAAQREFDML